MPEKVRVLYTRIKPAFAKRWDKHVDRVRSIRGADLPESDFVREALEAAMLASEPAEIGVGRGESIKWRGVR